MSMVSELGGFYFQSAYSNWLYAIALKLKMLYLVIQYLKYALPEVLPLADITLLQ